MAKPIYTSVAGVTFDNDDGTNRQDIIRRFCNSGDELDVRPETNDRFGIVRSATVWLDWHWGTNCPLCPCATTIEFVTTKRPQLNHDFPGVRDEG
jgi:hypothetical protein